MKRFLLFTAICLVAFAGCNQSKPTKTIENLKAGIKGESTASAKYAAFAVKAKEEGLEPIARLFEAASKAESIHAANHLKVLETLGEKMEDFKPEFEVKSTIENLQAAIDGESYEVSTMYPKFLSEAGAEKVEKAVKSFTWAKDTEKKHLQFYTSALEALKANNPSTLPSDYAVCPVCGNTYDNAKVDERCAFCQTGRELFLVF
jgi:rubrerythrin